MKNLRKIVALFLFIFITGIFVTIMSVNRTLDKKTPTETVEVSSDSLYLNKTEKKAV